MIYGKFEGNLDSLEAVPPEKLLNQPDFYCVMLVDESCGGRTFEEGDIVKCQALYSTTRGLTDRAYYYVLDARGVPLNRRGGFTELNTVPLPKGYNLPKLDKPGTSDYPNFSFIDTLLGELE